MTALAGHADLVRIAAALRAVGHDITVGLAEAARALGYERLLSPDRASSDSSEFVTETATWHASSPDPAEPMSIPYWQPVSFSWHDEPIALDETPSADVDRAAESHERQTLAGREPPRPVPLAQRSRVVPQLQRLVQTGLRGRDLDVAELVRAWARGIAVRRLPRSQRQGWPALVLLLDRSFHLVPFWRDQLDVRAWLRGLVGHAAVVVRFVDAAGPDGLAFDERGRPAPLLDGTLAGLPVVALTDLGWYGGQPLMRAWLRLGRRLRRAGERVFALAPVPPSRWTPDLARVWTALAWERPLSDAPRPAVNLAARADRLLVLAAHARRLEPGLLRALRLLLPPADADVGTEADAWMHEDLVGMASNATVLRPDRAPARRSRFARAAPALRARVAAALHSWHWHRERGPEVWHAEALLLAADGSDVGDAAERAEAFMARLARQASETTPPARNAALRRWLDATSIHAPALFDRTTVTGRSLQRAWAATHPPDNAPPDADPRLLSPRTTPAEPRPYELVHVGDALELHPLGTGRKPTTTRGSRVAVLWASAPFIYPVGAAASPTRVSLAQPARIPCDPIAPLELRTDRATLTLHVVRRPDWAAYVCDCGRDRHGLWFSLRFDQTTLTMRWLPPGFIRTAVPKDDHPDEDAPNNIVIRRGFWVGDTPVSQALWTAVMDTNPSRLQHPDRPVDHITREQAQQFAERLDERMLIRGSRYFRLPTESEWEYAVRAGTIDPNTSLVGGRLEFAPLNRRNLPGVPGDLWEWCRDNVDGTHGVARGGAWDDADNVFRLSRRVLNPQHVADDIGFRIVLDEGLS